MPTYEIRRFICAYNPAHGEFEERFLGHGQRLLFPDGRRINWQNVCAACRKMRAEWEERRDIERFREAEEARQRRQERAETRNERQREADMVKLANIEAQMALLEASRDKLRKKYFSQESEKHLTPTK